METVIGILDSQTEYAKRLAGFIDSKNDIGCMGAAFGSEEELKNFNDRRMVKTLLISKDIYEAEGLPAFIGNGTNCIILSEDECAGENDAGMNVIFKYRPADEIIKKIMSLQQNETATFTNVFAYFSPDAQVLASVKAFAAAKEYSKKGRTLFLSWEAFGAAGREKRGTGKDDLSSHPPSISEVLYLFGKGEKDSGKIFENMENVDGVDLFTGADYCSDLWAYSGSEMRRFVAGCRESGKYEYIIIAVGFYSDSMAELMSACEKVFLITLSGPAGEIRKNEFYRQMKYAGNQELLSVIFEETKERNFDTDETGHRKQ